MDQITAIGALGATLILVAFILDEVRVWNSDTFAYDAVNLAGGALLLWYAWALGSYPFMVLNGVWTAVALRDVIRRFLK